MSNDLKGHGNEAVFLGFLQKLVPHRSLSLRFESSRSDFGFEFAEIFIIEKRLPDSPTWRVGESFIDYEYLHEFEAKIGTTRNVVEMTYAEPVYAKTFF